MESLAQENALKACALPASPSKLLLLTGATGYVGGRLLPSLVEAGWRVRCLARQPKHLSPRVPAGVEGVQGDLLDAASLSAAMHGVEAAYYLVHSMGATGDFQTQDRLATENFATAARAAGVQRIIYLGGLGEDEPDLSAHLRSRHEVGERLRAHAVPVIEFRTSIIIGSGSLSFEMIRALVERLPVMITPRWVRVTAQPIAIDDVLEYLRQALKIQIPGNVIFEIGGPDRVSYGELMREYAAAARPAPLDDSCSAAESAFVESLAGAGDATVCPRGPQAGG